MSAIIRKIIHTAAAPAAIGPYSQAVLVDRTMYISGQIGMDVSGQLVAGGVQAQAKQLSKPQCCWQTLMTSITSMMFTSSGGLVEIEAIAVLGPITDAS
ncbi:2-iminobutanoate/2-iminopropanoate deaminase [Labeo rohita]|uniref:2-iminobutanoate/2-iminopropanoate deaminase n=1 Tax=Labeo rohita TaxID=84645 RepID=A0ABQ8LQ24_LABRO|nr:2-iminobutanoate/2-iminopropanoate deaminase [Labeo rohita]